MPVVETYAQQMKRARALRCTSVREWCILILENRLPFSMSPRPDQVWAREGWGAGKGGWKAFLGLEAEPTREDLALLPDLLPGGYIEFDYAKGMAESLACGSVNDWYLRGSLLHSCVPREPWKTYFGKGFTTLEAFITA